MKLTKLSDRRDWVSNTESAQPASWQVTGTDIFLIGHSGGMGPYYSLHRGGQWKGWSHEGGVTVDHQIHSFQHARREAIALATTK